jgi:acetolactate synthase small subunit
MQSRLGAMDRILGALTHRGFLPKRMVSSLREDKTLEMMISFDCDDFKAVEKLVKFLQKQVYVMDAHTLAEENEINPASEASNITPLFVSDVINDYSQRRIAHANNA